MIGRMPEVSGRNAIDFDNWMRLDVQILLRTVPVVITAKGAH